MAVLEPLTELNEDIRSKATASILALEKQWTPGDSILVWNNLFFRRADGTYYATFHDIADLEYSDWIRSNRGVMEIMLWWVDGEIIATGDLSLEDEFGTCGGLIDSGNRVWMRSGPQSLEPDPDYRPRVPLHVVQLNIPTQVSKKPSAAESTTYHPGERVLHPTFGEGIVVNSRLIEHDEEVTVTFGDKTRRLLASFARIQHLH